MNALIKRDLGLTKTREVALWYHTSLQVSTLGVILVQKGFHNIA